jgi:putative endonuclease
VTEKDVHLWKVYMIQASDGSLYTGITTDVARRFNEHLNSKQGAKYFQGRKPEKVVYVEEGHDRSSASKREAEIKRLRREQKLELMAGSSIL